MGDEAYGGWNHLREEAGHPTILGGGELTSVEGPRSSNSMVYLKRLRPIKYDSIL
jgi:hypothetical protein